MKEAKLLAIDPQPPISPDVITRLNEICTAIQNDAISAVGVAVVYRDGSTGASYSSAPNVGMLIAAVTRLQHRLLRIGEE